MVNWIKSVDEMIDTPASYAIDCFKKSFKTLLLV